MRFVTYNIHRAVGASGRPSIRSIAEVLREFEPDVVGLNEVVRTPIIADQPALLGHMLGMEHAFQRTTWSRGMAFGNAVLVRGRIDVALGVPLPGAPLEIVSSASSSRDATAVGGAEPRGLLLVACRVDGVRFAFGSAHLAVEPEVRAHQVRVLASYLADGSQGDVPLVIAGDFNAEPPALAPFREFLEVAEVQPTYPARDPRAAIDHVFFSSQWRCTRVFAVPAPASDHAALVVDLEPTAFTPAGGSSVY